LVADTDVVTSKLKKFFSTISSQSFPPRIIHLLTLLSDTDSWTISSLPSTRPLDGTPVLHPYRHLFPQVQAAYGIDLQFFGDSILVSPVTQENATSLTVRFPEECSYNSKTYGTNARALPSRTSTSRGFLSTFVRIRSPSQGFRRYDDDRPAQG
jgi:hypothetical protein